MKGLGTDEKAIIDVLARRSISQRLDIVKQFKTLFGLDLIAELDSEISGNFFKVCRALCLEPEVFDAEELREAVEGIGTDEDCLIEIICCRTNEQILKIKEAYRKRNCLCKYNFHLQLFYKTFFKCLDTKYSEKVPI